MKEKISFLLLIGFLFMMPLHASAYNGLSVKEMFEEYSKRFESIESYDDVEKNGFEIMKDQSFPVVFESFGEEEMTFFAALDTKYNRLAVFVTDAEGSILFKTNQLETNYGVLGEMNQPIQEVEAVSFLDINHDERKDIILITRCVNEKGLYKDETYKVGDVLFQGDGSFYRDYRISEKINRFGMNKSAKCIISFVRDGRSAEFLYTATNSQELFDNGFDVIEDQCYPRTFEKLGRLQVLPGVFSLGDYDIFMIYLTNDRGNIVWSFQPMEGYDNLYSLRGISCKDLDGDGMKDLVVLARYSREGAEGTLDVNSDCAIYYQRTGGFDMDRDFEKNFQCEDTHKMEDVIREIRKYWGWQIKD